ncbi:MAG TPA: hypothetical protein VFB55_09010, partial [Verrucomicrobiae bacterium]|nr:hypothetical protein [Verrucomicrobiae bacterium]
MFIPARQAPFGVNVQQRSKINQPSFGQKWAIFVLKNIFFLCWKISYFNNNETASKPRVGLTRRAAACLRPGTFSGNG